MHAPTRHLSRLLTFASCAILAWSTTSGCETLQEITSGLDKPTARVVGANVQGLSLEDATLAFDLEITNPYAVDMPLVNLAYALQSRGTQFLDGSAELSGTIPANGSRIVTVPARIPFQELLSVLSGVKPGSMVPYAAALDLSVDAPGVGPLTMPLKTSGEVPVPAPPTVSVGEVRFDELSLNAARATAQFEITNPNAFDLNLHDFDYALSLAGEDVAGARVSRAAELRRNGGSATIELPLSFSPLRFGAAILNVLRGDDAAYEIAGDMQVDTPYGPLTLPFGGSGNTTLSH